MQMLDHGVQAPVALQNTTGVEISSVDAQGRRELAVRVCAGARGSACVSVPGCVLMQIHAYLEAVTHDCALSAKPSMCC